MRIGLPSLLTALFVGLKLTGHIQWPWLWVVSPTLISMAIGCVFITIAVTLKILSD